MKSCIFHRKSKGLVLASMPSSGSDWLAECMVKADPSLKYSREHFSPLCNLADSELLCRYMGDYLYGTTHNLSTELPSPHLSSILEGCWNGRGLNFTKENYLAFKLPAFAKQFGVVVLARRTEDTFPPNRQRVTAWYEHAYHAAVAARLVSRDMQDRVRTPMDKAVVGHQLFLRRMLSDARALGLPILWWHDLIGGEAHTAINPTTDKEYALVSEIVETATPRPKPLREFEDLFAPALKLLQHL
jgi:hypothetical protein